MLKRLPWHEIVDVASHAIMRVAGVNVIAEGCRELLDSLTPAQLDFLIKEKVSLWSEIPEELRAEARRIAVPYRFVIRNFPDDAIEEILQKVRPDLASAIMATEDGLAWFASLVTEVRADLLGGSTDGSHHPHD